MKVNGGHTKDGSIKISLQSIAITAHAQKANIAKTIHATFMKNC